MTPSDLAGLSPLEAAARAVEWAFDRWIRGNGEERTFNEIVAELRAADRAKEVPHHCAPHDIEALIIRLRALEDGQQSALPSFENTDWRTLTGVCARVIEWQAQTINGAARQGAERLATAQGFDSPDLSGDNAGSTPAAAPPSASPYWMVERSIDGRAHWWMRPSINYEHWDSPYRWTTDSSKAVHFPAKEAAELIVENDMCECFASEHMDVQMPEQASPEPVAWKHSCNALCMEIELWIGACPHCGRPRNTHPPEPSEADELLREIYERWKEDGSYRIGEHIEKISIFLGRAAK